jgi:hypothetical protein
MLMMMIAISAVTAHAADRKIDEKDVPKVVLERVRTKYKGARLVGFQQKVRDGRELVEVKIEGEKTLEVNCGLDGTIVYESEKVPVDGVPESVRSAYKANKQYEPWTFHHAERVVLGEQPTQVHYKIKVVREGTMAKLEFTPDGHLIKTEEKPWHAHSKK